VCGKKKEEMNFGGGQTFIARKFRVYRPSDPPRGCFPSQVTRVVSFRLTLSNDHIISKLEAYIVAFGV